MAIITTDVSKVDAIVRGLIQGVKNQMEKEFNDKFQVLVSEMNQRKLELMSEAGVEVQNILNSHKINSDLVLVVKE